MSHKNKNTRSELNPSTYVVGYETSHIFLDNLRATELRQQLINTKGSLTHVPKFSETSSASESLYQKEAEEAEWALIPDEPRTHHNSFGSDAESERFVGYGSEKSTWAF